MLVDLATHGDATQCVAFFRWTLRRVGAFAAVTQVTQ